MTYPTVESSSLSHPILHIIISAIITSYNVDCSRSVFSAYFLECCGNILHGILSNLNVYQNLVIHHFLQITSNLNSHHSVSILPRYRTNMSIATVLYSPLLFLNVMGTQHVTWHLSTIKCLCIFTNTPLSASISNWNSFNILPRYWTSIVV